jgi:hypothetical protein
MELVIGYHVRVRSVVALSLCNTPCGSHIRQAAVKTMATYANYSCSFVLTNPVLLFDWSAGQLFIQLSGHRSLPLRHLL